MTTEHKDDGGPAFPHTVQMEGFDRVWVSGMSLRDYFAGQALAGIAACTGPDEGARAIRKAAAKNNSTFEQAIAGLAYEWADAMLAEREQP